MGDFMKIKIIDAAGRGDLEDLEFCLKLGGVDINCFNEKGQTALIAASTSGHTDCVKRLLTEADLDVNLKAKDGKAALFVACQKGFRPIVSLLLKHQNIDPNTCDKHTTSALMVALRARLDEIVGLLLKHNKLDINFQKNDGTTALMFATSLGHSKVVKALLLRKDIELGITNKKGQTAQALAKEKKDKELIAMFEDHSNRKESRMSSRTRVFSANKKFRQYADTLKRNSSMTSGLEDSDEEFLSTPVDEQGTSSEPVGKKKPKMATISKMMSMRSDPNAARHVVKSSGAVSKIKGLLKSSKNGEAVADVIPPPKQQPKKSVEPAESEAQPAEDDTEDAFPEEELQLPPLPPVEEEAPRVKRFSSLQPELVGPEYETEVGKLLASKRLEAVCKNFYDHNIKTIYVAAKLSDFELTHTVGVEDPVIRARVWMAITESPAGSIRPVKKYSIFLLSKDAEIEEAIVASHLPGTVFRFSQVNFDPETLTKQLIEAVDDSGSFVTTIDESLFLKGTEGKDFDLVYQNLTALAWAYSQKSEIVGIKSKVGNELFKLVLRQGGGILSNTEWEELKKFNIDYPIVYDAIEFLSKNVVTSANYVDSKLHG